MTIRPILIHPDPRLKKLCAPIPEVTPEIATLAADMLETMYDAPGIGLAAPQVGVLKRLFVMDVSGREDEPDAPPNPMVVINPEILWRSPETAPYEEGCLSLGDNQVEVTRPTRIRLRWRDLDWQEHEQEFDGIGAICAQHEIDHLDGKLIIDTLGPMKRRLITHKLEKFKRDRQRRQKDAG